MSSNELLSASWVKKQFTIFFFKKSNLQFVYGHYRVYVCVSQNYYYLMGLNGHNFQLMNNGLN